MSITVPVKSIDLQPGSVIALHDLTWQDCEKILDELGEDRHTRIAYCHGTLEIMSPLSRHERPHRITGDIVKAILDSQGKDWEDYGSTTFYRKGRAGIEPDTCFYIAANADRVRSCQGGIDVEIYPPPDLVIESDATSRTVVSAYEAIAVPEIWVVGDRPLQVFLLEKGGYIESKRSQLFPDITVSELVPQLILRALEIGTSAMLREFKATLSEE
ncbi:MAG: Uma2 family endonuclease [Oscillatoriales cyanobacterium SM2_2_1]|nr:Uma2 family endonuclease [Oscillatoriales cyanobacterium SM2_2_1]